MSVTVHFTDRSRDAMTWADAEAEDGGALLFSYELRQGGALAVLCRAVQTASSPPGLRAVAVYGPAAWFSVDGVPV